MRKILILITLALLPLTSCVDQAANKRAQAKIDACIKQHGTPVYTFNQMAEELTYLGCVLP